MSGPTKKLTAAEATERLRLAAMGMESEFSLYVDGRHVRPEGVFGDPTGFVREPLMHRRGTSYHLPTGGAVYFDTGVIEIATPVIEIERGVAARAGRSLWEGILYVRQELDAWERRTRHEARLVGFSTHYSISFEHTREAARTGRSIEQLSLLLAHILPAPVMILATNRRSTGVGVRPRGNRIEVTADFTPSPALMIATGTVIVGIVREVMRWPTFDLSMLERMDLPVMDSFRPMPHTTRHGWLARFDCFVRNPFEADVTAPLWHTRDGRTLSLRQIAARIVRFFWPNIRRLSDPFTLRMIAAVVGGRAPSLLELHDRPPEYEDVGRLCTWDNLFPEDVLSRSLYERVLIRAIAGQKLHLYGYWYTPVGMRGWSRVVFRRDADRSRHVFGIDFLIDHLRDWERPPLRRRGG